MAELSKGVLPNGMLPGRQGKLDPSKAGENWATFEVSTDGIPEHLVLRTLPGDKNEADDATGFLGDAVERYRKDPDANFYGAFDSDESGANYMHAQLMPLQRDFEAASSRANPALDFYQQLLAGGGEEAAPDSAAPEGAGKIVPQEPQESWGQWFERLGESVASPVTEIAKAGGKRGATLIEDLTNPEALKAKANAIGPGLPGVIPTIGDDVLRYLMSPIEGLGTATVGAAGEAITGGAKETAGEIISDAAAALIPFVGEAKALLRTKEAARTHLVEMAAKNQPKIGTAAPGESLTLPVIDRETLVRDLKEAALKDELFNVNADLADVKPADPGAAEKLARVETVEDNLGLVRAAKDGALIHGTTKKNAESLLKSGSFSAAEDSARRQYDYSAIGDDTAYFTTAAAERQGGGKLWLDRNWGDRMAPYDATVPADLAKDARIFRPKSLAEAEEFFTAFAERNADVIPESVRARGWEKIVDYLGADDLKAYKTLEEWRRANPEQAAAIARLRSEIDGIDTHAIPTAEADSLGPNTAGGLFGMPQVAVLNPKLLTGIRSAEREFTADLSTEERKTLMRRRDELLTDTTPEKLKEGAAPAEQRRTLENQRTRLTEQLAAIKDERADAEAKAAGVTRAKGAPVKPGAAADEEETPASFTVKPVGRAAKQAAAAGKPVEITDEVKRSFAAYAEGKGGESPIEMVVEAIADPRTRRQTVLDIGKLIPKGAVKPIAVTKANAYAMQAPADEIMARIRPQFASDEDFAAAGIVLNSAGESLHQLARRAVATGEKADWDAATQAYAALNKYAGDLRAAKTDWGRAGRIQQEAMEAQPRRVADITKMMEAAGPQNVESTIRKIAGLDDPKKVAPFVSRLRSAFGRDGLLFYYQNILLSNPKSVLKEFLSDGVTASWDVATRGLTDLFGGTPQGSAMQLAYGYTSAALDSLRLAARAWKTGKSQFAPEYQSIEGNVRSRAADLASGMAKPGQMDQPGSAAMRYLRMALPTNWQMALDDFNKSWNYNAYRRTFAYERALSEGGDAAAIASRHRALMENTPQDLHQMALDQALKNSFQEPLTPGIGAIANMVNRFSLLRIAMPFTRVPLNLAKWTFETSPLAPLSPHVRADFAAGGTRQALAMAKVGLGTVTVTGGLAMWAADNLTGFGPHDPDTRRAWLNAGNQPYSWRLSNRGGWTSYLWLGPAASIIGATADTADTVRFMHDGSGDDFENIMWSLIFGTGQAMLAPSYMTGIGNFFDAVMNPEENAAYFGQNLVTSIAIPQAVWGLERASDPWRRAHYGLLENAQSRIPGLSKNLPPARDTWGKPVKWPQGVLWPVTGSPLAQAVSPIYYKPPGDAEPIDTWIWENRLSFPRGTEGRIGINAPGRVQSFSAPRARGAQIGVSTRLPLTTKQLDRLKVLAGNEFKIEIDGKKWGAKDLFNGFVQGAAPSFLQEQWNGAAAEAKAVLLQQQWGKFRDGAKAQLLEEDAGLRQEVADGLRVRAETLSAPAAGGAVRQPVIQ